MTVSLCTHNKRASSVRRGSCVHRVTLLIAPGKRVGISTASTASGITLEAADGCCGVAGPGPQPLWIRDAYSVVGTDDNEAYVKLSSRPNLSGQHLFEHVSSVRWLPSLNQPVN